VTVGRQIHEGDELYNYIPAEQEKSMFFEFKDLISPEDIELLEEAKKKRKGDLQ